MDWDDGGLKGDEFWVMGDGGDLGTEEDQVDREGGVTEAGQLWGILGRGAFRVSRGRCMPFKFHSPLYTRRS